MWSRRAVRPQAARGHAARGAAAGPRRIFCAVLGLGPADPVADLLHSRMSMRWKKILCPIDFSEPAAAALKTAAEAARENDAELVLVHVYQPPAIAYAEASYGLGELIDAIGKDAEQHLAEARRTLMAEGVKRVETRAILGIPWDVIVNLAGQIHADVVIIGTRGRSGIKHVLLGSVAERVVRHSPCPVLVVR
jgi:nucleotide-binding universal stress UspA family protein